MSTALQHVASFVTKPRDIARSALSEKRRSRRRKRDDSASLPVEAWWRATLNAILEDDDNVWTRAALARAIGTSKTTISEICDGGRGSSWAVGPISTALAEFNLHPPEIRQQESGVRAELLALASELDDDALTAVVALMRQLHSKSPT